jgi:hypothetical protein
MGSLYQVVYTGELQPGTSPEQAARGFADVFKVDEDKARALVLGEQEHVLKKDVDEVNARRYREILLEIGLQVRVETAAGELLDDSPAADFRARAPEMTLADAPARQPGPPSEPPPSEPAATDADRPQPTLDPYAPPSSEVRRPAPDGVSPTHVRAGHGWRWVTCGIEHLRRAPVAWIGAVAILFTITLVLVMIPLIGSLASALISPILLGGLMLAAHGQRSGRPMRPASIFDAFAQYGGRLATVGALYLVGTVVVTILLGILMAAVIGGMMGIDPAQLEQQDPAMLMDLMGPTILLLLLGVLALTLPLVMAYWFAPALVVLNGMTAVEAMKASLRGCLKNILPFLVYGLAWMLIGFLALIPMLLIMAVFPPATGGADSTLVYLPVLFATMLVVSPIMIASMYCGYRDIFRAETQ